MSGSAKYRTQQVRELYRKEFALVDSLTQALAENPSHPEVLHDRFEALTGGYRHLLNQVIKLTLISDTLQDRLKRAEAELSETVANMHRLNRNLRALNEKKDEVLAMAAHDVRSPLAGIQGLAEMLASGDLDGEGESRDTAREIATAATEILRMVSGMLVGSETEVFSGDATDLETTTIRALVQSLEARTRSEVERKKIGLTKDLTNPDAVIVLEQLLFMRIADNLLSNALKFSPAGGAVHITLGIADSWLEFRVKDSGPGITPADRKRIFHMAGSLSAKPTGGEQSTGIGLTIVNRIVNHLGGSVSCESEPGQGAEFIVRLPVREVGADVPLATLN